MRIVPFVGLILTGFNLLAQVSNNDIGNRSKLLLDGNQVRTSTANSTVEWSCINKKLTNKCLVYHNDQWFNFQVVRSGKYFINISSQKCRDLKGIQLILIEGNPCEISTYEILDCIPQIRQEDVFVELNQLRAGITYLVNVDGFLDDFCEFSIQLSSVPKGLPRMAKNLHAFELNPTQNKNIISLDWKLNRKMAGEVEYFEIYRNLKGKGALRIRSLPIQLNAYGAPSEKYSIMDTLPGHGNYLYQIFGVMKSDKIPLLLTSAQIQFWDEHFNNPTTADPVEFYTSVKIGYDEGTQFKILLYDRDRERELWQFTSTYNKVDHESFKIYFDSWVKSVKRFTVIVTDGQRPFEYYYRINQGKIVQE